MGFGSLFLFVLLMLVLFIRMKKKARLSELLGLLFPFIWKQLSVFLYTLVKTDYKMLFIYVKIDLIENKFRRTKLAEGVISTANLSAIENNLSAIHNNIDAMNRTISTSALKAVQIEKLLRYILSVAKL